MCMCVEVRVGEIIVLPNGRKVVCVESEGNSTDSCLSVCVFHPAKVDTEEQVFRCRNYRCLAAMRQDNKGVHFEYINTEEL